jgi:hypothetical protein
MNEVYTVDLVSPTAEGSRRLQFHQAQGDSLSLGDDGVITVINEQEGAVVQVNPHAWLFISTDNIDFNAEDADD